MLKRLLIAPFAALLVAGAANADTLQTLTLRERAQSKDQLAAEVVEEQTHRSAMSVIAQDALYGGIAGLAVRGAGWRLNDGDKRGRDPTTGVGAGLLNCGIFGGLHADGNV